MMIMKLISSAVIWAVIGFCIQKIAQAIKANKKAGSE
jgi:hypothetical protein